LRQTQTPSPEHTEFDQLCAPVDEFEYLPVLPEPPAELDLDHESEREQHELDKQILTGLVSPV
jgi:hypothetical protein